MAEEDLHRVAAATGGTVQTSVNNVIDEVHMFSAIVILFNCIGTYVLVVPPFFIMTM